MEIKKSLHKIEDWIAESEPRAFDRYLLGPFLVWYGLRYKKTPKMARRILVTAGIWQIFYAWKFYQRIPKNLEDLPGLVDSALSKGSFVLSETEVIDG